MKKSLLLILTMRTLLDTSAQKIGIEQYFSYTTSVKEVEQSTLLFAQHRHNLIFEIRYNYDAKNAFSINAGRSFSFEKDKFSYVIRPTAGIVVGSSSGINLNLDQEVEMGRFYISSKFQRFISLRDRCQSFFYTWQEGGICFSEKFYGGLSLQMEIANRSCSMNKGIVLGFSTGRWNFPVYIFDFLNCQKNITAGILYNINFTSPRHFSF
jgi:hypothetical protein